MKACLWAKKCDASLEKGKGIEKKPPTSPAGHSSVYAPGGWGVGPWLKIYYSLCPPSHACLWAVGGAMHSESTMLNLHTKKTSWAIARLKKIALLDFKPIAFSILNLPERFNYYTVRDTRITEHPISDHVVQLSTTVSPKLNRLKSRVFWSIIFGKKNNVVQFFRERHDVRWADTQRS